MWLYTAIDNPDIKERAVWLYRFVEDVKIWAVQMNHDGEEAFFTLAGMNPHHDLPGFFWK